MKAATQLEARDLTKRYRERSVVDGVSLSMRGGEVVGLLGPNGAGKTTTFYMIVGLVAPDTGTISLSGRDITEAPMFERARLGVGYLPQEPSVFRRLTVEENILAIAQTIPEIPAEQHRQIVDDLIGYLSLERVRRTRGAALSGGERRRVEIARALVRNPSFLLLDEPFAGIDPIITSELQEIIRALAGRGIGVLITDHNVYSTLQICDRAYILFDGRVVEEGAPSAIAASPNARRYYLGEDFDARVVETRRRGADV